MKTIIPIFLVLANLGPLFAEDRIKFNQDIRPILADRCFTCHGPDQNHREAGLRLDLEETAKKPLESGTTAIVPGKPEESELYLRITGDPADRMPPPGGGTPLTEEQIRLLKNWISEGSEWESHWAFAPLQQPKVPLVPNELIQDLQNPIDAYLLSELSKKGLRFSPVAERSTLIRRLTLDLTGLPPSEEQLERYLWGQSPEPLEKLVDELLASPRYGERMAVYWLDLVRYADTVGYHGDQEREISGYRDYVIHAFNENLPFDRFSTEQLAGDLLDSPSNSVRAASGYNMLGMTTIEGGAQPEEYLAKYAADRVRNFSSVWLGLTMGCAECHDHKFDPLGTKEFYELAAFFSDIRERGVYDPVADLPFPDPQDLIKLEELRKDLEEVIKTIEKESSPDLENRKKGIEETIAQIGKNHRKTIQTVTVPPREMRVLPRGNWLDKTGELVQPNVPRALPALLVSTSRPTRRELANWLWKPENPLPARVAVNRFWKLFFGRGISNSLDDLGTQGEWPTNGPFLDWLAWEFRESGYDVKKLVRTIVLSRAYSQSSVPSQPGILEDPENRFYWRQNRWRLEAEFLRDQALESAGLLEHSLGGRSVRPYQPDGYYKHLNFPPRTYTADRDSGQYRRGLYVHWQRTFLHPQLLAFDAPNREECTTSRPVTSTPRQALVLLNDPTFVEAARGLAERALKSSIEDSERIRWMVRTTLARQATERELEILTKLLNDERDYYRANPEKGAKLLQIGLPAPSSPFAQEERAAWTALGRSLLNLFEFVMRE